MAGARAAERGVGAAEHGAQEQEEVHDEEHACCPTEQEQEHDDSCCPGTPTRTILPPSSNQKTHNNTLKNTQNKGGREELLRIDPLGRSTTTEQG